jgi:hypothetical protein
LKQALSDDAGVDEYMVSVDFSFDCVPVFERFPVQMLIAIVATQRLHISHPEVIGERTDQSNGLFEAVLDFEAQCVQANDLDGIQRGIGAHEQAVPSAGMNHGDEAHELADRTPQKIARTVVDHDVVLAIDRAWGTSHGGWVAQH